MKINLISARILIGDTDVVNDVTSMRQSVITVWSYDFNDTKLSTEKQRRYMINCFFYIQVSWLVDYYGLKGPLKEYFSLYRVVSQRDGERKEK